MNETRVIVIPQRKKKVRKVRVWKKRDVANQFREARVNYPPYEPTKLSGDGLTIGTNRVLGERLGQFGHRAVEEIRESLSAYAGKPAMIMNLNRVDNMRVTGQAGESDMRRRFCLWYWWMSLQPITVKQRDAAMLFAAGFKRSEIEKMLKVRRGVGKALELIEEGVREYCELAGWIRSSQT